ncbi:alpha-1,3-arabinosyltransferase XAT2-like [Miscanthus floridulus]|uniref:alpha-1,3-arabinosyltransferase XAT2-like n=1 Tax=Miscanthus floridulus TaxID=154761 RepID=UPI003457D76C
MKSSVQGHLNVGLVAGVLFVLLTYLVVSQQTAISRPNVVTTVAQWLSNTPNKQQFEGPGETVVTAKEQQIADKQLIEGSSESEKPNNKVVCSTEERLSDYCEVDGDVRINGKAWSVDIVPSVWSSSERREWKIRPYSRRSASNVDKLNVTQLQDPAAAPPCTVTHHVPGVVFALGGYSGNAFHDHADVLLPLFLASLRYDREVQFLVINRVQPWWLGKYRLALRRLSKYDVVNLDGDAHVRCFPHLTVGLRLHKDFGVVPEWVSGRRRVSMPDFTRFLREAYALPRGVPTSPAREPGKKPRLMLIQRQRTRRFLNGEEMVRAAEAAGFEVTVTDLVIDAAVDEQARVVNSFDVMVGIHGAGMTNEVFLPPGGVLIQVVPWGKLDLMARIEYGEPAADMRLKYLRYDVTLEESSLLELLGRDHPAIKDPESVHRKGWAAMFDIYMTKQDVRLDITRFGRTLAEAMDHLRSLQ